MTANPYQAPSADVNNSSEANTYSPQVFSFDGRIGRLRYLAYSLVAMIFYIPALIGIALGGIDSSSGEMSAIGIIGTGLSVILVLGWMFVIAKRRFNDINVTGWLCLLMIIPLVNAIVSLVLLFVPGTQGSNNFGPMPEANSVGVKITAFIMIGFVVLAIVGGIAGGFMSAV